MSQNISLHKRTYFCYSLAFLCSSFIFSQNLILNPSFEDSNNCPAKTGSFHLDVKDWEIPTEGSTDYFSTCSKKMSTKHNFNGRQEVYDGNAFVGFYMFAPDDYREYITAKLSEPLQKDKKYIVSFMVSLADKAGLSVSSFEMVFTKELLKLDTNKNILLSSIEDRSGYNFVNSPPTAFYSNKKEWTRVTAEFIANGTEKYMMLGNFGRNIQTRTKETGKNLKKAAYYYVDQVSLVKDPIDFDLDKVYVLKDVKFNTDTFILDLESKDQLNCLIGHLKSNPELKLTIYGHTDDQGSKKYNKELSRKRAKAVSEYLLDKGLRFDRIAFQGYGNEIPVAKNSTSKGRLKNRRVEFVLSKKTYSTYVNTTFEEDDE